MTVLLHADLKAKQRRLREGFPMPLTLRIHRALSWLERAEATGDDRDVFRWCFETLLGVDLDGRLYATVRRAFYAPVFPGSAATIGRSQSVGKSSRAGRSACTAERSRPACFIRAMISSALGMTSARSRL